jgi:hypothetical protein
MVERPEVCSSFRCQLTTLANFGAAVFGYDNTGVADSCYATISNVPGSVGSFGTVVHPIEMVSPSGSTLDTASSLASDEMGFMVTYG